jgi:hypothetical protein
MINQKFDMLLAQKDDESDNVPWKDLFDTIKEFRKDHAAPVNGENKETPVVPINGKISEEKTRLANAIKKGLANGLEVAHLEKLVDFIEKHPLKAAELLSAIAV